MFRDGVSVYLHRLNILYAAGVRLRSYVSPTDSLPVERSLREARRVLYLSLGRIHPFIGILIKQGPYTGPSEAQLAASWDCY